MSDANRPKPGGVPEPATQRGLAKPEPPRPDPALKAAPFGPALRGKATLIGMAVPPAPAAMPPPAPPPPPPGGGTLPGLARPFAATMPIPPQAPPMPAAHAMSRTAPLGVAPTLLAQTPPVAEPPPPYAYPQTYQQAPPGMRAEMPTFPDERPRSDAALPPAKRTGKTAIVVGVIVGAALALLATAAVVWVLRERAQRDAESREAAARAPASVATTPAARALPPEETTPAGCAPQGAAKKLWGSIHRQVPPALGAGSGSISLAFAADASAAVGLAVDPKTIAVEVKQEQAGRELLSAVPLAAGKFAFVRDDFPMTSTTAVVAPAPFVLGQIEQHVASADLERPRPSLEWRNVGVITAPSVASAGAASYAVTFRAGGQSGKILFGRLDDAGKAVGQLHTVARDHALVGTPAVAASAAGALIGFASRPDEQSPWSLALARVRPNEPPAAAGPFAVPAGGPGKNAISPSLAAFEDGRWLVQWTEGESGAYRVRVQQYASDLKPLGDAVVVSPEGLNAGQGTSLATSDGALVVFIVAAEQSDELWGLSLRCQAARP